MKTDAELTSSIAHFDSKEGTEDKNFEKIGNLKPT
jgi:hypothetical protein